jgi:hypothetical protein
MKRQTEENQIFESDAIHRALATEEPILPSSGFLSAVMERVEEESSVPARIAFPWKRAIPGFLLTGAVFGWGGYVLVREGIPALRNIDFAPQHFAPAASVPMEQAAWVGLALAISLLSWMLARRLAGQSN